MQVSKITFTEELWRNAEYAMGMTPWQIANKAIEIALAEQSQEQYITAEEARKLGADAEFYASDCKEWRSCKNITNFLTNFDDGEVIKYRAIKQPEPVETIDHVKLLGEIYGFLESICPEGIADEAFRIVPEAIRTQAIAKYVEPSDTLGERVRHTQEAGRAEVEPTCQVRNDDTGELKTMTREKAKLLQAETKDVCDWFNSLGVACDVEFNFDGNFIYRYKL